VVGLVLYKLWLNMEVADRLTLFESSSMSESDCSITGVSLKYR